MYRKGGVWRERLELAWESRDFPLCHQGLRPQLGLNVLPRSQEERVSGAPGGRDRRKEPLALRKCGA